jgi:hypothetical protein
MPRRDQSCMAFPQLLKEIGQARPTSNEGFRLLLGGDCRDLAASAAVEAYPRCPDPQFPVAFAGRRLASQRRDCVY